ncbi:MAG TPA: 4Fe-4S dicluster domain-containing protein [Methanoculleus sp.]|nr:4Fe-4S dicluster domain-containing protein [Methanoculleus sp.]
MGLNVGCAARPGRARDNKTGSWRVFRPTVDSETCKKCGLCVLICPEGCIREDDDGMPVVDFEYCKGCGLCAEECPAEAIAMEQEEK